MRNLLTGAAATALIAVGAIAVSASPAAARVVCNGEGDCWHVDSDYRYHPEWHVSVHPDSWYFHNDWDHDHDHHWRGHHEGRGYWHNGVWITF